jgi:hypothetical protein
MPGSPIGPNEWVDGLKTTARHFFGQQEAAQPYAPKGTTAPQPGGGGQAVPTGKNPFADATWNDTEQARIINSGPDGMEQAKQLAAAAGTYVGALPPGMRRKTAY